MIEWCGVTDYRQGDGGTRQVAIDRPSSSWVRGRARDCARCGAERFHTFLDEEPDVDNPELLQLQFDQVRENLPDDGVLQAAIDRAMRVYGPKGTPPENVDPEQLVLAVAAVRAHVS